jgi:hypothetical protein
MSATTSFTGIGAMTSFTVQAIGALAGAKPPSVHRQDRFRKSVAMMNGWLTPKG